jgi:hypothetical protein
MVIVITGVACASDDERPIDEAACYLPRKLTPQCWRDGDIVQAIAGAADKMIVRRRIAIVAQAAMRRCWCQANHSVRLQPLGDAVYCGRADTGVIVAQRGRNLGVGGMLQLAKNRNHSIGIFRCPALYCVLHAAIVIDLQ